jgi:hypothetical protein
MRRDYTAILGGISFLAGAFIFANQCLHWAKDGVWTDDPLRSYFNLNVDFSNWRGIEKLWGGLLDTSAALVFLCVGCLLFWAAIARDSK